MFGVARTGLRFVLTNFEQGKEVDAGSWYDTYAGQILFDDLLVNAFRFENQLAASSQLDPRFAALYDIVSDDVESAWPATDQHDDYPHQMFDDQRWRLVSVPLRATYALENEAGHARSDLSGVVLVMNDGPADESRMRWTDAAMATGLFTAWARFGLAGVDPELPGALVEPVPPHASLEVYETVDADPGTVLDRVSRQVGPPPTVEGARHYAAGFRLLNKVTTPRGDLA